MIQALYDLARTILGLGPRPEPMPMAEPKPGISWEVFFHYVEEQLLFHGTSYIWNPTEPGESVRLLPLFTPGVKVQRDAAGVVTGYLVGRNSWYEFRPTETLFQPDEVMAIRRGEDARQKVREWLNQILPKEVKA